MEGKKTKQNSGNENHFYTENSSPNLAARNNVFNPRIFNYICYIYIYI